MELDVFVLREQYPDLGHVFLMELLLSAQVLFRKKIIIDILQQEMILGELRSNFHSCSLHNFAKFVAIKPSTTKFDGILNIFLKVMKLGSLERLEVSGVIFVQLFTMYWNKGFFGLRVQKIFLGFLVFFFVFVSFRFIVHVRNFNL